MAGGRRWGDNAQTSRVSLQCTVRETTPRFESTNPSHAEKVKESAPTNPGSGKKVAIFPFKATVPLLGCDTIRKVSGFPFGSVAVSVIATEFPDVVVAEVLLTTAGRLRLASSLEGPL